MLILYFKDFEFLRRYLTKHNLGTDLEGLDFEAIDKEIDVDEATEVVAAIDVEGEGNVLEAEDDAPGPIVGDDAPAA